MNHANGEFDYQQCKNDHMRAIYCGKIHTPQPVEVIGRVENYRNKIIVRIVQSGKSSLVTVFETDLMNLPAENYSWSIPERLILDFFNWDGDYRMRRVMNALDPAEGDIDCQVHRPEYPFINCRHDDGVRIVIPTPEPLREYFQKHLELLTAKAGK